MILLVDVSAHLSASPAARPHGTNRRSGSRATWPWEVSVRAPSWLPIHREFRTLHRVECCDSAEHDRLTTRLVKHLGPEASFLNLIAPVPTDVAVHSAKVPSMIPCYPSSGAGQTRGIYIYIYVSFVSPVIDTQASLLPPMEKELAVSLTVVRNG